MITENGEIKESILQKLPSKENLNTKLMKNLLKKIKKVYQFI